MNVAFKAMLFARHIHKTQVRKYTGNPYADHLAEVAGIVAASVGNMKHAVHAETMIAVAWLHDCVEDQNVEQDELVRQFGSDVANGVMLLSDMDVGNRASRKRASCTRLASAPGWVQTIKCADLISNMASIELHDPNFAVTFGYEKRELLNVMTLADPLLRQMAMGPVKPFPTSLIITKESDHGKAYYTA